MSDEQIGWIALVALRYHAIVFLVVGRLGTQPLLLPWAAT